MYVKRYSRFTAALVEKRVVRSQQGFKTVYIPVETICAEPAEVTAWIEQKEAELKSH